MSLKQVHSNQRLMVNRSLELLRSSTTHVFSQLLQKPLTPIMEKMCTMKTHHFWQDLRWTWDHKSSTLLLTRFPATMTPTTTTMSCLKTLPCKLLPLWPSIARETLRSSLFWAHLTEIKFALMFLSLLMVIYLIAYGNIAGFGELKEGDRYDDTTPLMHYWP